MSRRLRRTLAALWVIGVLVLVPLLRLSHHYLDTPLDSSGKPKVVQIRAGLGLGQIARKLAAEGIISRAGAFHLLARVSGDGRRMKFGEYKLSPRMTPKEILRVIRLGTPLQYRVTFPEGTTLKGIARVLDSKGLVSREDFLDQARNPGLSTSLGIPALNVEGYLFPDTYYFSKGMSAESIIRKMVARFKAVFSEAKAQGKKKTRLTDYQTVILASLVEAETKAAKERKIVAGVFVRRLKKRMLLQCDPTVIYGLKDFSGRITKKNLAEPHPYNTYIHPGLPPGPIGNPGRAALTAALFPADTKYLYFVAKNDGTHYFSTNYSQHQRAVNKYQR